MTKAQNDWRDVGRPSSCNASQLPPFLQFIKLYDDFTDFTEVSNDDDDDNDEDDHRLPPLVFANLI